MDGGAVWRGRAIWLGGTLLLAVAISFFCGVVLSDLPGFDSGGSTLEGVASGIFSLAAAVLLRTSWPRIRAWNARAEEWSVRHPAPTIATTALLFSLGVGLAYRDPVAAGWGLAVGGAFGWLSVRGAARRRQPPDALDA